MLYLRNLPHLPIYCSLLLPLCFSVGQAAGPELAGEVLTPRVVNLLMVLQQSLAPELKQAVLGGLTPEEKAAKAAELQRKAKAERERREALEEIEREKKKRGAPQLPAIRPVQRHTPLTPQLSTLICTWLPLQLLQRA